MKLVRYIYLALTLSNISCFAATSSTCPPDFYARLEFIQKATPLTKAASATPDIVALNAQLQLSDDEKFSCFTEDVEEECFPGDKAVSTITKQRESGDKYSSFLLALFSLTGRYSVIGLDAGSALPLESEASDAKHPLHVIQSLIDQIPEAVLFLYAVYRKLPPAQHDSWWRDNEKAVTEKHASLNSLFPDGLQWLQEYYSEHATTYTSLANMK